VIKIVEKNSKGKKPNEKKERPVRKAKENEIFVGKKPIMNYVNSAMAALLDNNEEVHIKARGRSISSAVDVSQVLKNRFVKDVKIKVELGTEEIEGRDKRIMNVSSIDITLKRGN